MKRFRETSPLKTLGRLAHVKKPTGQRFQTSNQLPGKVVAATPGNSITYPAGTGAINIRKIASEMTIKKEYQGLNHPLEFNQTIRKPKCSNS